MSDPVLSAMSIEFTFPIDLHLNRFGFTMVLHKDSSDDVEIDVSILLINPELTL